MTITGKVDREAGIIALSTWHRSTFLNDDITFVFIDGLLDSVNQILASALSGGLLMSRSRRSLNHGMIKGPLQRKFILP